LDKKIISYAQIRSPLAMATLCSLKQALREIAQEVPASSWQRLSDIQYSDGFDILVGGSGSAYRDFIVPQLSQLFSTFNSPISLLEIGPGPKSVLGYLPRELRRSIEKYTAFEPNNIFATKLEDWLRHTSGGGLPLPCLEDGYTVHRAAFSPLSDKDTSGRNDDGIFDVILFCHSLYGMKHKRDIIEQSLRMLVDRPRAGMLVVFHRDYTLRLDGLLTDRRTSFPTGITTIPDKDETLDAFASFLAGFTVEDNEIKKSLQVKWRVVCRTLGRGDRPGCLSFSSPETMMVFNKRATALSRLALQVPLLDGIRTVKNREARLHHPAAVVVPTEVEHIQRCVQWAIEQGIGLTVIGGGHSGHCLWPGVVSIDMSAFNQVRVHAEKHKSGLNRNTHPCVVAGAGCKTEDIIRDTMVEGLTVPLGFRPSVGAGLWLQGGLGHLARLYGLACDAILGAIMVSVKTGEIIVVGYVPSEHVPLGAVRPNNGADVLWALRGAGTNIGIVISVTFKAFPAPFYSVRNWIIPVDEVIEAHNRLSQLGSLTSKLPRHCSADVYLYRDNSKLRLGVAVFEILDAESPLIMPVRLDKDLGPANSIQLVDGVGLFDCEMYMSGMHGGHGSGKTSSFKRCLFLKNIGQEEIVQLLVAAFETCPTPLCYVHLLHGGGAVRDQDRRYGFRNSGLGLRLYRNGRLAPRV
jgi:hypothetical protein